MRTLAIANHKGGVGKTATAHALGKALTETQRILMVDADPQGSLTTVCGVIDTGGQSMAEVTWGYRKALPQREAACAFRTRLGVNVGLAPGPILYRYRASPNSLHL